MCGGHDTDSNADADCRTDSDTGANSDTDHLRPHADADAASNNADVLSFGRSL
jgi:hypothetical protein